MIPKDTRLTAEAIEAVKDKLRPEQYDMLMPWAEGKQYQEIAQAFGIPIGTVKSRVNRGRAAVVKATAEFAHAAPA